MTEFSQSTTKVNSHLNQGLADMWITQHLVILLACFASFSIGLVFSTSNKTFDQFEEYSDYVEYQPEQTTVDPELGSDCVDRKGNRIPLGQEYHPYTDSPCSICECLEDKRMMSCSSVGCEVLDCLSFDIDEDSCCGYTCKEGGSVGNLDVRQVGSNSLIIQWSLDDDHEHQFENVTWEKMTIHYSEGFGKDKPWIGVPVRVGDQSAMVSGLKHGVQYTFKAIANLYVQYYVELSFKAAQIVLEQRVGNSLKLEKEKHAKELFIYKGNGMGQFKWKPAIYINLNAFYYVTVDRKVNKRGKVKHTLRLFHMNSDYDKGDLNMQTGDEKLFRWVLAHL